MCALRRIRLAGTQLAQATCGTIRQKLLKIGARVTSDLKGIRTVRGQVAGVRPQNVPDGWTRKIV